MSFNTINPTTEEVLVKYKLMSKEEVINTAMESEKAFHSWKGLSFKKRAVYFSKLARVLRDNKQEYAELMANEMGKPLTEGFAEVEKCAGLVEVLIENAEMWLMNKSVKADGIKHTINLEPLGPIFIIMPWNYPFWQVCKVALPPLLGGNTIILKHARNVTGSSLAIEEMFRKAGFPKNIFRSVVTDHESSGELIAADCVAACSLTGSVGAGSKIASQAGKHIKKSVMELGGSDPHIILADADIEIAAQGAVLGRMSNSGQICIGSKRIIVHKDIAEKFTKRFVELVKALIVGDPLSQKTQVGPLAQEKSLQEMEAFVRDAVKKGAKVLSGGKRKDRKGFFFEPTVLGNVTLDMDVMCHEVFGPIAPIVIFETDEEAIEIANNSEFGLNASIWTYDLEKGKLFAKQINAGGVFINSISKSHPMFPLGGIKKSGYGRELGEEGIREFMNIKTLNVYEHK